MWWPTWCGGEDGGGSEVKATGGDNGGGSEASAIGGVVANGNEPSEIGGVGGGGVVEFAVSGGCDSSDVGGNGAGPVGSIKKLNARGEPPGGDDGEVDEFKRAAAKPVALEEPPVAGDDECMVEGIVMAAGAVEAECGGLVAKIAARA